MLNKIILHLFHFFIPNKKKMIIKKKKHIVNFECIMLKKFKRKLNAL